MMRKATVAPGYYEDSRTSEYILTPFEFHLNVCHRFLDGKKDWPKLKIHLKTPSVGFHASDYMILLLMKFHKEFQEKLNLLKT